MPNHEVNIPAISSKKSLVALNVSKEYGDNVVLDDITVAINPTDKIGLIGRNGSGKSALLRILSGNEEASQGEIRRAATNIGYLPQNFTFKRNDSVYGCATEGVKNVLNALESLEHMSKDFRGNDHSFLEKYSELQELIENSNRYGLEDTIHQTLSELGLSNLLTANVSTLSGGEAVRLALARILINDPDILLLDEPTNHLDLHANLWLRGFLTSWAGGFLIVSHDRDFLSEVTTSTWELETGRIRIYGGNYEFYRNQKAAETEAIERETIRLTKQVKKTKRKVQSELQRAAHSARRDLSKNPEDHDRFRAHFFKERAGRTAGRKNKLASDKVTAAQEQLAEIKQKVPDVIAVELKRSETYRRKQLVEVVDGHISYAEKEIVRGVRLQISLGDRIAIFGNNGAGKSTLAKALLGNPSVDITGEIRRRENINVKVLDQNYLIVDPRQTVLSNLQSALPELPVSDIRQHLARYLFRKDTEINKLASALSGGETARLAMAMITMIPIDLLILDEPTNNLDVSSIEEIENTVASFGGAILVVSHDLSFLKRIGIDRSYVISDRHLSKLMTNPSDGSAFKSELLPFLNFKAPESL